MDYFVLLLYNLSGVFKLYITVDTRTYRLLKWKKILSEAWNFNLISIAISTRHHICKFHLACRLYTPHTHSRLEILVVTYLGQVMHIIYILPPPLENSNFVSKRGFFVGNMWTRRDGISVTYGKKKLKFDIFENIVSFNNVRDDFLREG